MIHHKHIFKLDKNFSKQFISSILITVKKDQTIKLAIDWKKNEQCHPEKQVSNAKNQFTTRQYRTNCQNKRQNITDFLDARPMIFIVNSGPMMFINRSGSRDYKPVEFPSHRRYMNSDITIPNWFSWIYSYASRVAESKRLHTHKH